MAPLPGRPRVTLPALTGSGTLKPADVNPLIAQIEARLATLEQAPAVDALTARIAELEATVAALQKQTSRLDWLATIRRRQARQ